MEDNDFIIHRIKTMKPGYLLMTIVLISIPLPSQLFILDLYDTHIQRSKSAGKLSSPQSVIKGLKRKKKKLTTGLNPRTPTRSPVAVKISWALLNSSPSWSNFLEGATTEVNRSNPEPMTAEVDSKSVAKVWMALSPATCVPTIRYLSPFKPSEGSKLRKEMEVSL